MTVRGAVLGVCAVLVVLMNSGLAGAVDDSRSGFCDGRIVHDYEQSLDHFPRASRPPFLGRIPFGPESLRLERFDDRLVVGGGLVGVVLRNSEGKGLSSLGLRISQTLLRVGANDRSRIPIRHRVRRVGNLEPFGELGLNFAVGSDAAFYQVTFFEDESDQRLGTYTEFFRALRPKLDVRLVVSSVSVMNGETISFRFRNPGTVTFRTGLPFSVERQGQYGWELDSFLTPTSFPMPAFRLGPGRASPCQTLTIPQVARPGVYRVTKRAVALRFREPRAIQLIAPFSILAVDRERR